MEHFEKAYFKALRFLSYRQRSEKEVRDNLTKVKSRKSREDGEEIDSGVIDLVINKLKEQRFINDEEFARIWIESRMRAKPRAIRVIKMELKQKGIHEEIIESLLYNPEIKIQNDLEMATQLIEKKIHRYKNLHGEELRNKLGQLLASKGFNWDTIKKAVGQVIETES